MHPLNCEDKFAALVRFARWQCGSRLVSRSVVHEWVNKSRFFVKTGETGLTLNIYTGLHEFSDMGYLLHVLRSEDFFVDVGANVGSYSILAGAAIGSRGIAFEPLPHTYMRLTENLRLNHLEERVISVNKGVGAEQGNIVFTSGKYDAMNHALAENEQSENTVNVEVTTLDACLKTKSPSLIKIDVEGFETPVLEGADETLKKESLHSVIMELNGSGSRYGYNESKILEKMQNHGFMTYSYDPLRRKLINLEGKNMTSGNTLFIRDKNFIEERLRNAPKVKIHGREF